MKSLSLCSNKKNCDTGTVLCTSDLLFDPALDIEDINGDL
jgi:hypothetical protein